MIHTAFAIALIFQVSTGVQVPPECLDLAAQHRFPPVLSRWQAPLAYAKLRWLHRRYPGDERIARCYDIVKAYRQQEN